MNFRRGSGYVVMWAGGLMSLTGFLTSAFLVLYLLISRHSALIWPAGMCLLLGLGGAKLFRIGRRVSLISAQSQSADDARPAVLLLRAFSIDGQIAESSWYRQKSLVWMFTGRESFEEELAAVMGDLGPTIALGRPGDILPMLGFAREYVSSFEWKDRVRHYVSKSGWVVFLLGEISKSMEWEFEFISNCKNKLNIIFILPPMSVMDSAWIENFKKISYLFKFDISDVYHVSFFMCHDGKVQVCRKQSSKSDNRAQILALKQFLIPAYLPPVRKLDDDSANKISYVDSEWKGVVYSLVFSVLFFGFFSGLYFSIVKNNLIFGVLVGVSSGILFSATMCGFIFFVRRLRFFGLKQTGGWSEDEKILSAGMANLMTNGLAEGGILFLSTKRLRFVGHRVGAFVLDRSYSLSSLAAAEAVMTSVIIPNGLLLRFLDGRSVRLVVYRRKMWARKINEVASLVRI